MLNICIEFNLLFRSKKEDKRKKINVDLVTKLEAGFTITPQTLGCFHSEEVDKYVTPDEFILSRAAAKSWTMTWRIA